jgi:Tol biopolymer transport system component
MKRSLFIIFLTLLTFSGTTQEVLNSLLLNADKLFIKRDYETAVTLYLKYLEKYPRDYYAERQTAVCFDRLNSPDNAIDHWPIVVESSEATEKDYLDFGKSLLANNRGPEAKKIFAVISKSTDKSLAAWGKAYLNSNAFFKDSAFTRVIEIAGINSEFPESCPVIFKEKMFYVSDKLNSPRIFYALNDEKTQTISGALKKDSVNLFPTLIIEKLHQWSVNGQFCFSPDGSLLYFCRAVSNKELKIKSESPFYRYQIYTLNMSTLGNFQPEVKRFQYNSPNHDFMHPCLSHDGKRLYFASDMKGSMGGKDIFMCEWDNGKWKAPVNLGPQVNSPGNEVFPHVSEDSTLYFASDQRPGLGGLDIFYATPSNEKEKLFNESINAGANINSRFDDFGIYVLKSGNRGYLTSNRKNNTDDDIYYFISSKPKPGTH